MSVEYLEFLGQYQKTYSGLKDSPETFTHIVSFLLQRPERRTRRHLFNVFRLSCLCLTVRAPDLPVVKFPGMDSGVPRRRLYDVIIPAQSYLANVSNSETICTTEPLCPFIVILRLNLTVGTFSATRGPMLKTLARQISIKF